AFGKVLRTLSVFGIDLRLCTHLERKSLPFRTQFFCKTKRYRPGGSLWPLRHENTAPTSHAFGCFQPTTALTAFGLQQLWLPSAYNRFIRAYLILEYKKSPAVPGAAA
ncbi:MAG: hypothetical protein ACI3ZE_01375, partial [Candidatus Woodwardiibium sp.]